MVTLWIEPFGGMAGDMFLAALLDLGDPRFGLADLRSLAQRLVPGECSLSLERVWRGSLSGSCLSVHTQESAHAPHRYFADLKAMLERAAAADGSAAAWISPRVCERSLQAFWRLAEAEARVHDTTPDQIHFHEVGAVDSLIDVVGAALALERLGVQRIVSSPPLVGSGTVRCAHGEMPVPAPAVAELMRGKVMRLGGGMERLTPTAAAILTTWVDNFSEPRDFLTRSIGYGAGQRDSKEGPPNLLRVQLGAEAHSPTPQAEALLVEVNLDDMTGEEVAHAVERLRKAEALDVWTSAIQMKKNRPGILLSALLRPADRGRFEHLILESTTTLGMRWTRVDRSECPRSELVVEFAGLAVRVKRRLRGSGAPAGGLDRRDLSPENDDLQRVVEATGLSLREAEHEVLDLALRSLGGRR